MKPVYHLLLLAIFIVSPVCQADFIVTNVNIVDVSARQIRANQSVVVVDDKIAAVIDASQLPSGFEIIDGNQGYLTPGLIDMHVHMYEPAAYTIALSHGVTHVRIMNGMPAHLDWREQVSSGKLVGASSTVSSPILSGYLESPTHHGIATATEARNAVRRYHQQGYDLIKAYGNLSEPTLRALIAEASLLGIPVAKHGPHGTGTLSYDDLTGLQSFEHVEDIYQGPLNYAKNIDSIAPLLGELKASGVPITPTLNIYERLTNITEQKEAYIDATSPHYTSTIVSFLDRRDQVKRWLTASDRMVKHNKGVLRLLHDITGLLYKADIELLVGSDSGALLSPHGIATHNEMRLMHEAGVDRYSVLAGATINAAKALNLQHRLGTIAATYDADFVLTKQNPLTDLAVLENPEAVVKQGRWYSQPRLAKLRRDAIAQRSLWSEARVLYEGMH